ncbi:methyl-accepting chemotaxis protein [Vibrio sp. YMD68]|uniref:HAMP domain-containing methyl-accepting chemotaxis protein n=1 Tax=Vibrio sp. YMD68 TaxID=3042300 RepID=UPI00249A09DB|nr:methyl-accepting chemotaxis protein [Vibrio sp. YMD68]WGV98799.1 methyl-accepting chemotaxis protein [Vibrio sp. YMD68]
MKLSIVQRTIGGYFIMFLLLALLGGISYYKLTTVDSHVRQVTQKATPLLVETSKLQTAVLKSQRSLLEYITYTEIESLPPIQQEFNEQREVFFAILERIRSTTSQTDKASVITQTAEGYFSVADQVMSQHTESIELNQQLNSARQVFVKFEDSFQKVTLLLLDKVSKSRSQSNKVDRLTSGIQRDLRTLRAANPDMDLTKLVETFTSNVSRAKEGIGSIKVSAGVIARFEKTLAKLEEAGVSEKGMLPLMIRQRQLQSEIRGLIEQAQQSTRAMEAEVEQLSDMALVEVDSASSVTAKSVESAEVMIIVMTLASAFVAAIIGYLTSRSIHKPLSLINRVLRKMTQGDMTHHVNYQSSCEFGELSNSIDQLVSEMKNLLSQINSGSDSLAEEAQNASQISDATMSRVSTQKQQIDLVAAAISEMEVSVSEVFRSTEQSQEEVKKANTSTQESRGQVASSLVLVEELLHSINTAVDITHKLDEFSNNIGSILDVIRGIAEQTNLLALNAAIEAARAGEHGRGFAVVADEVRTLATRTQQSTVEIQRMIESLQESSQQVVEVMNESQDKTKECVEQSRITDETLKSVAERMESINDMSMQVAHASEEQIVVSRDIAKTINEISEVAIETETEARGASSVSDVLAQLAQQQRTLVNKFKL